ncbi:serine/threonine-protein kinase [Streptomyces cadmiisoli]|uniref:non-specific serine/threonine protein kinase n=1 Tax=Streptomyces cadmiisoli TaxID=2184053 RepID=A0A2Z4IZR7_9ACTN|nr:serine/threonine-protein kinase [Streptomyces cadmiisoli]AWW38385.1 serine/threonine protein kinase [Streptomyces cadmiisoli]
MAGDTPDRGEGRVINGRYRLSRTLGAGGMGRVWLAYDEELACEVAMKEIALPDVPMDAGEPAQRIARARSEARHAARLRGHPHVATVHDVVVHEGLPWIVMEYVPDSVDLQAVIRGSGPLPPARVARIGLAVLDALNAGHRIGILHRDVKPANILLAADASGDPYARVLLTDYGIALQPGSREPRITATAGILGTPGYLAPERARGEPPTPAADLFSLGATLYAAVEGRGPFDRDGEFATLTALLGEEPTPPVRAGELAPVLHGLLVKDPLRRSAPEPVARGLERAARGTPEAGPAGPAVQGGAVRPAGGFGPPPSGFGPPPGAGGSGAGAFTGVPTGSGAPTPGHGNPQTPGSEHPRTPGHGNPRTPGWPRTPDAPHTQVGASAGEGPDTPGAGGGPAAPGGQAYGAWPPPAPHNPYAQSAYAANDAQSPYAGSGTPPSYAAGGGTPTYAGGIPGRPWGGGGPGTGGGAPSPAPGGDRKRRALVALVVAAVLVIAGGTWAAVSLSGGDDDRGDAAGSSPSSGAQASPSPTGPALPYGDAVGLTEALAAGDCVQAVWTGTPFKSPPNLGVVDCAEDWPDGQVLSVETATDHADAHANGARRCAEQSRAVVDALPDAGSYAVLPTRRGFSAAGGGTACLVLGRHAAIGGEVGRFRDTGTDLWVGQMSIGDCWTYEEVEDGYKAPLTDCAKPHTEQVIGTVRAPASMTYDKGSDNATKLCENRFESTWAPGAERTVYGWVADEEDWDLGFKEVVCTVSRVDDKKTTGKIPTPGQV